MPNKFYSVLEVEPHASAGTWTTTIASNIPQRAKVAADETPTLTFAIPANLVESGAGKPTIKSVSCQYTVATAALDAAPSIVFNLMTMADTSRAITRAAAADTTTVSGTDTTGTAAGTFAAKGSFDQPLVLNGNQYLTAAFAFDCAATTVLTVRGISIETA